jgi:tRNA pseudouridine13 synthase
MKIKQGPDDFQVDELTDLVPSSGQFSLYFLDKSGWTTPDALARVRRAWKILAQCVSFGGLKDRHAHTTQHITIADGPARDFAIPGIVLKYLGRVPAPFESSSIRANRFRIVVRDLSVEQVERARLAIDEVRADGLANYFDDQRFGSVENDGDFMARRLVLGNWEGALKLALTAPYVHDRAAAKQEKAILLKYWGQWAECQQKLPRGPARNVVHVLASRPGDFRGAITRLPADLATLYLAAYQSHLWNRALARWLERLLPVQHRVAVRLKLADAPMPRGLSLAQHDELARLSLPLPSARLKYDEAIEDSPPDWPEVVRETLAEDGVELNQMKLQGLRKPFFSRGVRAILCQPTNLSAEAGADERHPKREALTLRFELPRGSYATLLIKRIVRDG